MAIMSRCEELRSAITSAIDGDRMAIRRLTYAKTTVSFRVEGADAVTLRMVESRPEVAEDSGDAEITIDLGADQAEQFALGHLPMPAALMAGNVSSDGPVRKYLEVDPILRGLLLDAGDEEARGYRSSAPDGGIDRDLLAVEIKDVHKSFGRAKILRGLNMAIPEGMISVVVGPSGTGKSVLLNHILGLMKPDKGDVLIRGRSVKKMKRAELLDLRSEIGVMFQDGALFSAMNVYDNVAFPLRQHTDLQEDEVRELVLERLTSVGLSDAVESFPGQLSGGMKKRAGLARALIMDPSIVLCDEPDSGLDPVRTALLGDLIASEHAECGGTILVVTHNIALARRVADHISVLWQGKVIESGMLADVLASEDEFVQQFLAGATAGPLGMDA
ncbi:MAG: phospholipid/cholesterol/gamma-HCH transport system ATP-binding protein [Solirubrobacteraceae bacterium]|jgi:phospholipid/cholesterol/gamma-HCH transport system ATP-binding protein|nr:phospholipid/cholesterol/gamma-HCH transport system ATP-binding protein [Solirubrobacteraceae bacterium]